MLILNKVKQLRCIRGLQKAAILLIALGPERSANVFKHLKEDEILYCNIIQLHLGIRLQQSLHGQFFFHLFMFLAAHTSVR